MLQLPDFGKTGKSSNVSQFSDTLGNQVLDTAAAEIELLPAQKSLQILSLPPITAITLPLDKFLAVFIKVYLQFADTTITNGTQVSMLQYYHTGSSISDTNGNPIFLPTAQYASGGLLSLRG
jgi:hypothetical protein